MVSREELYGLVWAEPMTNVAKRFEVSGSYLARVCTALNVPRPERGYWAKLAAGQTLGRQPLPAPRAGDPISWSKDDESLPMAATPRVSIGRPRSTRAPLPKDGMHGVVRGAKAHFEAGRPVEEGSYLKPYKKLLIDVTTSKACLDRALSFGNELFIALESAGHSVALAPSGAQLRRGEIDEREAHGKKRDHYHSTDLWSPDRPTVVYIGTVAIGLAIVEMSEQVVLRYVDGKYVREAEYQPPKRSRYFTDHSWTTTRDLPSGRLRLVAYSPYWRVSWSTEWQETKGTTLVPKLAAIVKELEKSASGLVGKIKEAERQAEIERQQYEAEAEKYRRQEDRRMVEKSVKDSSEQLEQIIQKWSHAVSVERFLAGVEARASELADNPQRQILDRLKLARELLGATDPMGHFLSWKAPLERYRPRYDSASKASEDTPNDGRQ